MVVFYVCLSVQAVTASVLSLFVSHILNSVLWQTLVLGARAPALVGGRDREEVLAPVSLHSQLNTHTHTHRTICCEPEAYSTKYADRSKCRLSNQISEQEMFVLWRMFWNTDCIPQCNAIKSTSHFHVIQELEVFLIKVQTFYTYFYKTIMQKNKTDIM